MADFSTHPTIVEYAMHSLYKGQSPSRELKERVVRSVSHDPFGNDGS